MIYLDHNATSPLLPQALEAMLPWLGTPANPSSAHQAGQRASAAVEHARAQVAALVDADPRGLIFTSGATEANHLALRGLAALGTGDVAVSAVEHPSVLEAGRAAAQERGVALHLVPVSFEGRLGALPSVPLAVLSVMAANHETGVRFAVDAPGVPLHVDGSQAAGRVPLALGQATALTLSSHKLGGPSGVGALVVRQGVELPPLLTGGSQERGRRAGTVNVAGVVGFGAACELAQRTLAERANRWGPLRQRVESLVVGLGGAVVGAGAPRLPQTVCAVFPGLPGELLVQALDLGGVCVSAGAACASGSTDASPVLLAMGWEHADCTLRVSLGPRSEAADVAALEAALPDVVRRLRSALG